jgi:glycosyltransferase involved in cell wall biosynthesis
MQRKPDVTVAICTHDNAEVLERALRRLAHQRVPGSTWELLVVDNRCSDRTPELLRAWVASGTFPAMRVVREEQLGLSNARRTAVREARSDLIAFIDDDCFLNRGWIAAAVAFARAHPKAGAFGGRVRIRWESPPTDLAPWCEWLLARQELGGSPAKLPSRCGAPLVGAGIVIRRAALLQSGWMEHGHFMGRTGKALTSGDDAEISFRIRSAGWDLWYTPTMKIDHVLAPWRSEAPYLARLHYAVGLTLPHIWTLSGLHDRTPLLRPYLVLKALTRALRFALSALAHRVRGRMLRSHQRWISMYLDLGVARGAWLLPAPDPEPRVAAPQPSLAADPAAAVAPRVSRAEPVSAAAPRVSRAAAFLVREP